LSGDRLSRFLVSFGTTGDIFQSGEHIRGGFYEERHPPKPDTPRVRLHGDIVHPSLSHGPISYG
jgi:hypothetical protein